MEYPCIFCSCEVRRRQQAVECDWCGKWQHRTCETGISLSAYREAVRLGGVTFVCRPCLAKENHVDDIPVLEMSVPIDDSNTSVVYEDPPILEISVPIDVYMEETVVEEISVTATAQEFPEEDTIDVYMEETVVDETSVTAHEFPEENPIEDWNPIADSTAYYSDLNTTYVVAREPSSFLEERSFNVTGRSFTRPTTIDVSLSDRDLDEIIPENAPTTFMIVPSGTKRGGDKLVDTDGYTYTRRNTSRGRVYWTCSVRNKTFKCYASVKQYGDMFTPSHHNHDHPAAPGALLKVAVPTKVKRIAMEDIFRPAGEIVEAVMKEMTSSDDFDLPRPDLLMRAANLCRQKLRPKEPTTLDFEINTDFIGTDFLVDDVNDDVHAES